jgi:signal transduction histidine kinase
MKHLTLILLLWSSCTFAQKSEVFRIDSLPKEGIVLDKGWKWHAGDDAEWAKVGYDDAEWEEIDPTKEISDLPQFKNAEIGFFRLSVWVDSNVLNKILALKIWQTGASEIYLNGQLIHQLGRVSQNHNQEQTLLLQGTPYSILFTKAGQQTLAIRYSFTRKNILLKYRPVNYVAFKAVLGDLDRANQFYTEDKVFFTFLSYYKFGILLFLGIIHLLLFLMHPSKKANLFIAIYAFLQSICFHLDNNVSTLPVSGEKLYWYNHFNIVLIILSGIFSLLTIYAYLKIPKQKMFWLITSLLIVAYPLCIYFPTFSTIFSAFIYSGLLAFEAFRLSLSNYKQNQTGVKFITAGWLAYIMFMGLFYLMIFGFLPFNSMLSNLFANLGLLSVPISYSLMLAVDFAKMNRELSYKLMEVEHLSREKEQLLASQNETLERQVTTRTAELNQSLETLKATQAQLIEREKMASLGELTAGIAHEIQNPLNFVNNFAEVSTELIDEMTEELSKGNQTEVEAISQDLKQNLEKINHHGKRASSIVKNMLEHSRTNTGLKEPTDINALIDECLRLSYHGMRGQFRNFQADYGLNLANHLPTTKVVKQDLGRVLLNLFNNAFYAVHERMKQLEGTQHHDYVPKVSASTSKLNHGIEIRIKDNGTGIPEALKKKIFQPFFTTKPTGEGTGLGLSLSYEIITKGHGGSLSIESVEGMGTTFIIELPFEPKT